MSELYSSIFPYRKGVYEDLDKKWEQCIKMQVFTGDAYKEALTDKEIDDLYEMWKKKRLKPRILTFREVATYVQHAERIADYRRRVKVERARFRRAQSRDKMKSAASKGDISAKKRLEYIKKTNRENMAKKRKQRKSGTSIKTPD